MKSQLKAEVFGSRSEKVIGEVVRSLKGDGFGVIARMDFASGAILRLCYPRSEYLQSMTAPHANGAVHCTAIVQESEPGKITVELRRSKLAQHLEWAKQADEKLEQCLAALH